MEDHAFGRALDEEGVLTSLLAPTFGALMFSLRSVLPVLLLAVSTTLGSCGAEAPTESSSRGTTRIVAAPSSTVLRFLEAIQAGDESVSTALLTQAAQEELRANGDFAFDGDRMDSFVIGEETLEGDSAQVTVDVIQGGETQQATMLLRLENGVWRIYGMSLAFGEGNFTINFEGAEDSLTEVFEGLGEEMSEQFEQAFSDMQTAFEQGGTEEQIADERRRFDALAAISAEDFDASWKCDVQGNGRTALELIEELVAGRGLEIDEGEFASQLSKPLTIELRGVSRMQAVEAIAESAGLYPVWPQLGVAMFSGEEETRTSLSFASGSRALPVQFCGPFLVEVSELEEQAPRPIGTLSLAVRALGLHPSALSYQSEMGEFVRVQRLRGSRQQPLSDEDMHHWSTPEIEGEYVVYSLSKDLTGLLRDVDSIGELAGEVYLDLPVAIESFVLRGADDEHTTQFGEVTVQDWGENVNFELTGTRAVVSSLAARTAPTNAAGDPLGTLTGGANGWGERLRANLQCPETPGAVDVKICREERLVFPFEFAPIALQRHADQPAQLEKLTFAGEEPIRARMIGKIRAGDFQPQLTLELVNGCNKDAVSITLDFLYLDASGTQLEDFPHTLSGVYDFEEEGVAPLLEAGRTIQKETGAAFMPEGTARVEFRLNQVEFPDGTEWRREP